MFICFSSYRQGKLIKMRQKMKSRVRTIASLREVPTYCPQTQRAGYAKIKNLQKQIHEIKEVFEKKKKVKAGFSRNGARFAAKFLN